MQFVFYDSVPGVLGAGVGTSQAFSAHFHGILERLAQSGGVYGEVRDIQKHNNNINNNNNMTTSDIAFLRKLAEIKRTGQFKISMEQLRRLDHIKQGQFTATITEEEEAMPPRFQTDIQDAEVTTKYFTSYGNLEAMTSRP